MNDPYEPNRDHRVFEMRIPLKYLGNAQTFGFAAMFKDGDTGKEIFWPSFGIQTAPGMWGDIILTPKTTPQPTEPEQPTETETPTEPEPTEPEPEPTETEESQLLFNIPVEVLLMVVAVVAVVIVAAVTYKLGKRKGASQASGNTSETIYSE